MKRKPYSTSVLNRLREKSDGRCPYCRIFIGDTFRFDGRLLNFRDYPDAASVDHIVPLIRGGLDTIENMQLTCDSCNKAKGEMTHEEFLGVRL